MTKASDNLFPKVIMEEVANDGSATDTPSADHRSIFLGEDGQLHAKDSAAAVTDIGGTASEILDIPTAETDDTLVLAPDGAGGVEFRAETGGSTTIKYGALKDAAAVTDDFAASSLDGAWSANSQGGSFATSDCHTQGIDGSHLVMGYSAQSGSLYRTLSNADHEWIVGGIQLHGDMHPTVSQKFPGIAILDSVGTGVALIMNTDLSCYLAEITTYAWTGTTYGSIANFTSEYEASAQGFALRLTRVGNVFDGYVSWSLKAWDKHMSATGSKTITADRVAIGTWKPNDGVATGRIAAEWCRIV